MSDDEDRDLKPDNVIAFRRAASPCPISDYVYRRTRKSREDLLERATRAEGHLDRLILALDPEGLSRLLSAIRRQGEGDVRGMCREPEAAE